MCIRDSSYPYCWRCDTPLIYYARDSWFIKMTDVREQLIKNNDKVNWIPESIGKGRFGDWLKNVQDWGISRDRYWGTPLNIWECACGHRHAVGSIAELKSMSDNCPEEIELHRPYILSLIHIYRKRSWFSAEWEIVGICRTACGNDPDSVCDYFL